MYRHLRVSPFRKLSPSYPCLSPFRCTYTSECLLVLGLLLIQEIFLHGARIVSCLGASLMLLACSGRRQVERGPLRGPPMEWFHRNEDAWACAAVVGASLICLLSTVGLFCYSALWGPPEVRKDISYCRGFRAPSWGSSPETIPRHVAPLQHQQQQARSIQLVSLCSAGPLGGCPNNSSNSNSSSSSNRGGLQHLVSLPGEALHISEGPSPPGGPLSCVHPLMRLLVPQHSSRRRP